MLAIENCVDAIIFCFVKSLNHFSPFIYAGVSMNFFIIPVMIDMVTMIKQEQVCCMLQTIQQNGTPCGAHENFISLGS